MSTQSYNVWIEWKEGFDSPRAGPLPRAEAEALRLELGRRLRGQGKKGRARIEVHVDPATLLAWAGPRVPGSKPVEGDRRPAPARKRPPGGVPPDPGLVAALDRLRAELEATERRLAELSDSAE